MLIIGDTHGKINDFINLIKRYKIENEVLIQVGDFGIGFTLNPSLYDFNYFLMESNNYLYVLRGNHDNPNFFINQEDSSYLHYSNIEFLKDYSVLNIQNKKILLIGGGISLDRSERRKNVSWWENEEIILDKNKLNELSKEKFDILITHVPCPGTYNDNNKNILNYYLKNEEKDYKKLNEYLKNEKENQDKILQIIIKYSEFEKTLKESLKIEKEKLIEIKNKINYEYWISGHIHVSNRISEKDKKYIVLNKLEFLSIDRESND